MGYVIGVIVVAAAAAFGWNKYKQSRSA